MQNRSRLITILRICSFLVLLYSLSMPIPVFVGLLFGEHHLHGFLMTFAFAFITGLLGWHLTSRDEMNLKTRDGFLVAVLFWVIFSAISTMPLYLDSRLGLSLTDAIFEGVSGITTTGASVLNDIDHLPKSILFYRAQLNFLGGLGIIVLAIAVMPFLDIGGAKLYQSEMPSPMKEEKFTPRLADTARDLWMIYAGLAACGVVAYRLAGMNWFDAVCHSLSTVSLGGFSTHADSLGYYQNPAIELVGGAYSIIAALNFSLYFLALHRRSLRPIFQNSEARFFMLIISLVITLVCVELVRTQTFALPEALVHGFFQTASIMTDNGLGAAHYPDWPAHMVILLLGASFFGGCVGSTAGGIKAMRFLLLYRLSSQEIEQLIHPDAVFRTKVGRHSVSDRVIRSVWALFFLYIFFSCTFVWGLMIIGHDFATAFGTVAACINNMGVGYGDTAAGFGPLKTSGKWLMCIAMIFGRLEIFPILIVFSRTFWRF
ncbi:TrkH family potassium uptake protein [Gynuella sp.]|uniref:TrkH family potassium uptake protein n=1 Tax=Gynuella sp. TaxID=2969146 RepID=UPI003D1346E2